MPLRGPSCKGFLSFYKRKQILDHEFQNGFRCPRGTIDSIFIVKQMIKKRGEDGLHTWLILIDLVKAFDRVPNELLWAMLIRQGVPHTLVSLLCSPRAQNRESKIYIRRHHANIRLYHRSQTRESAWTGHFFPFLWLLS
jgi:hypothetical protein